MDTTYYIEADFESAFLVNGVFRQKIGLFAYPADSPLYITVLPLSAVLNSYTIKLIGGKAIYCENLVDCFNISGDRVAVRLKGRHNYVYTPSSLIHTLPPKGGAYEIYRLVKLGKLELARTLMTESLSNSIDDESLISFFSPYSDIFTNKFPDINANYLLVTSDQKCEAFNFTFSGNLIDDIAQVEF